MSQMTQMERLFARIKQLMLQNPGMAIRLTILSDPNGEPINWFPDEPVPVEPKVEIKKITAVPE